MNTQLTKTIVAQWLNTCILFSIFPKDKKTNIKINIKITKSDRERERETTQGTELS